MFRFPVLDAIERTVFVAPDLFGIEPLHHPRTSVAFASEIGTVLDVVDLTDRSTVAVVSFGDLGREPRVHRQLKVLGSRYRVVGLGAAPSRFEDVEFLRLRFQVKSLPAKVLAAAQLLTGRFEQHYWNLQQVRDLAEKMEKIRADVIIAHDIDTLPAVVRYANGARILYDAHDYAPRQFEDRLYFRLFFQKYWTYLCKRYIPEVDRMITVCASLAEAYERDTGVRAEVITNAPEFAELKPRFRAGTGAKVRLVHHGAAIRSRKLEQMIRVMDHLDGRFELDLLLVPNSPGYVEELQRMANERPNVTIRPPVPMPELPAALNDYDVGIFLLEPVNFNYRFALPNKLFEFIQGRLAVAVSPSPEMARLVTEHDCGVVADDFSVEAFASTLNDLDHERIDALKRRSHEAAAPLSGERNLARIVELVQELAGR